MKVCGSVLFFIALLVDVSLQFGRFPGVPDSIPTPTIPGADGKSPFVVYLLDGKITLNPEYGTASASVRRDKSDNIKKMNGFINLKKEISCTTQVSMIAQIKNYGVWVPAFRTPPTTFDLYIVQVNKYAEMFFKYVNTTQNHCPIEPGYYVINKFVVDPEVFPAQLPVGEYILDLAFTMFGKNIVSLHFKAVIENQ